MSRIRFRWCSGDTLRRVHKNFVMKLLAASWFTMFKLLFQSYVSFFAKGMSPNMHNLMYVLTQFNSNWTAKCPCGHCCSPRIKTILQKFPIYGHSIREQYVCIVQATVVDLNNGTIASGNRHVKLPSVTRNTLRTELVRITTQGKPDVLSDDML